MKSTRAFPVPTLEIIKSAVLNFLPVHSFPLLFPSDSHIVAFHWLLMYQFTVKHCTRPYRRERLGSSVCGPRVSVALGREQVSVALGREQRQPFAVVRG